MTFHFVIPVYNEEEQIDRIVDKLIPFFKNHPGSAVWIVDNGSQDATWARVREQIRLYPEKVHGILVREKGQGRAFKAAMVELEKRIAPARAAGGDVRIVFSAADLPFGFSDVDQVISRKLSADLVIGSKAHDASISQRGFKRALLSFCYRTLRKYLLGMQTRDPQGSLIFKAEWLRLHSECTAVDFFFTTQLVYFMEREGAAVVEVPVHTLPDFRPSRVHPLRDGWKVFRQILNFALARGRLQRKTRHEMLPTEAQAG